MTCKQDTSLGISPSEFEQTIYQDKIGIKAIYPQYSTGYSHKNETSYIVFESTLRFLKLFTNTMNDSAQSFWLTQWSMLLYTLDFCELNECGGRLFYFLSNVVCLYIPSV